MEAALIRQGPDERVSMAEGARRLGLAHDNARKQLSAGKLRGEKRRGRWWVWVPMPEPYPDPSGTGLAPSGTRPEAVIARLESEVAFLRDGLTARTEEIRRRDHTIAGLVERVRELPAGETHVDAGQGINPGRQSDVSRVQEPEPMKPVANTLALGWRRWWRRITVGG